jgi:hypothetical protein
MIAGCATQIPLPKLPPQVVVLRDGHVEPPVSPLPPTTGQPSASSPGSPAVLLQAGDQLRVARQGGFTFSYASNRFHIRQGRVRLECHDLLLAPGGSPARAQMLTVRLEAGRMTAISGGAAPRRALVLTREMLVAATVNNTRFVVTRNPTTRSTDAWTLNQPIVAAQAGNQRLRITSRITYTAISDRKGLRLDIWPFSISPFQRTTTPADGLEPYWADGLPCSVGCTPPGVVRGWPLKPFHKQHAVRAGINEIRPANFHVAVDIEAHDNQAVYALQSGYAYIRYPDSPATNVDVGQIDYWHLHPTVANGQYVVAYKTEIGTVLGGFKHVALSEGSPSDYLNPLRPGGSLGPYVNSEPPIIGVPRIFSDGRVIVGAFGPQSFVEKNESYETPVLAPSSLAWRLYGAKGSALSGLEWAMRGSQNYPPGLKPVIFAPGAYNPGFDCFLTQRRCIPNWVYWLAGGLTRPLPLASLPPGRYRLTVYAWDWADKTAALDYWFKVPLATAAAASRAEHGPLTPQFEYDEAGAAPPTQPRPQ